MTSSAQDRTEQATPQRKREARKRGQVPRSRELGAAAVVGAGVLGAVAGGAHLAAGAGAELQRLLSFDAATLQRPAELPAMFAHAFTQALWLCAPLLLACAAAALLAPILLGGWNFSLQALKPDFSRISPASGLGRMFSAQGGVELVKSLIKVGWIGGIVALYLWTRRYTMAGLSAEPVRQAMADGSGLVLGMMGWLAAALLAIAVLDAPYQLWSHAKRLRMTRQEVRDEHKQSEGRPEVKARIRRMQMELSRHRMMDKVPTADVVVTNPTRYAVALKYDSGGMRAPRVVAKGMGEVAAAIRELAREHRVPLLSAPPLARALCRGVELDREIPAELYAAVARVLTWVYQLRTHRRGPSPAEPVIGDVPGGEPDA